jgi:hypothetical protein
MTGPATSPKDMGDIVSAAWLLCIRQWRTILPMAAVTWIAFMLLNVGTIALISVERAVVAVPASFPHLPSSLVPLLIVGLLMMFFNQLAFVGYALESSIDGSASVGHCYARAVQCYFPALGAAGLTSIVCAFGTAIWIGIPVAIFFAVSWFFSGQVCLAEGATNSFAAIGRSRSIVRGNWWRTAGILAAVGLLGLLPSLAVGALRLGTTSAAIALSALALALASPFLASAQTILYLDLRLRKHESISLTAG